MNSRPLLGMHAKTAVGCALLLVQLLPLPAAAAPAPADELAMIFRPFETEHVTLSPGGRHLAYTQREGEKLILALRDLAANTLRRVQVGEAKAAELSGAKEKTPATITFLRWAAGDRLVFNLNGENVWSIRADGGDPRRLGDAGTYAPPAPPPEYSVIGSGDGMTTVMITAPSALKAVEEIPQPVNVASMSRGDRYVYLEALMKGRGKINNVAIAGDGTTMQIVQSDHRGTPRVVLRTDAETGGREEWAETPQADFLLSDHQGYPRIIRRRENINNASSLTNLYAYADPKASKWRLLDDLLGKDRPLDFHETPERYLGERSIPLGLDHDGKLLYFASNIGRDTFAVYALDTKTWKRTDLAIETPVADLGASRAQMSDALIFDDWARKLVGLRYIGPERATLWFDDELKTVQRSLDEVDPQKRWEIVEWDESRERYLVLATSNTEPGIYYVFNPDANQLDELMTRAPWLNDAGRNPSASFGFQTRAGVNLSGYLTLPRQPILKRPPLVVLCHDGPWDRDYPGYNREAQALAWMGFMVLQVNFRGSAGFGRQHLDALRAGFDTVALDDVLAAIDAVAPKDVDRRLVAIMGRGYGGYLALRAMQLHPDRFRCAVALDAPTDLGAWVNPGRIPVELNRANTGLSLESSPWGSLGETGPTFMGEVRRRFIGGDPAKLKELSVLPHAEKIRGPVMIVQADTFSMGGGRELASAVEKHGGTAVFLGLGRDAAANLPQARAALFTQIHAFLNEHVYNYAVKLGDVVEQK